MNCHLVEHFEETVYKEYFVITKDLTLSEDCLDKADFLKKDKLDNYIREDVSAMFFGFSLAVKFLQPESY